MNRKKNNCVKEQYESNSYIRTLRFNRTVVKIPKDWSIDLAGEQSSETKITGGCRHGAGALFKSTELPMFAVIVEKSLEPSMKFSASAKIRVSSDFEKTREIEVVAEKVVIKKDSIYPE